jgi:catechol 2,3-dioxygenase-like lactoylglutathione lyase family enzyme
VAKVHHSAIVTQDLEKSLVFWRDGLGLEVLMDHTFEGPWPELFGVPTTTLHSVFLGEGSTPETGIVELVVSEGAGQDAPEYGVAAGMFLLSLYADLDEVLPRLAQLGVGGEPKVALLGPVRLVVVTDPNGVRVELMDTVARENLANLTGREE